MYTAIVNLAFMYNFIYSYHLKYLVTDNVITISIIIPAGVAGI